jgi:hypothetical protein
VLDLAENSDLLNRVHGDAGMKETFDIFAGTPEKIVMWLACIPGLANARARMEVIAASAPGQYFVFPTGTRITVAQIETSANPKKLPKLKTKSNIASTGVERFALSE